MAGGASHSTGSAVLIDARPQFLKQDVGSSLPVRVGFDQRVIEASDEVGVEVGADMLGVHQCPRERPESENRGVIHAETFA